MSDPNASDIWTEVLEWLRIAASDQRVAQLCVLAEPALADAAAYHCQQAAEKVLKGFLVLAGVHVPKTHDLATLASLVEARFASVDAMLVPLRGWTAWGVAYRYPGEAGPEPEPSIEELTAALAVISKLEAALRSLAPVRGSWLFRGRWRGTWGCVGGDTCVGLLRRANRALGVLARQLVEVVLRKAGRLDLAGSRYR